MEMNLDDVVMQDLTTDHSDMCDGATGERVMDDSRVPTLPTEILGIIMSFLPRDGLKNARLVNKHMKHFAQRPLFHTVHLKVNVDSFMKLENISLHDDLRRIVRRVFYDGRLLPWDFEDFQDYLNEGIGIGIVLQNAEGQRVSRKQFASCFTELEQNFHHQQYCQYLEGQKYLHRGYNEVKLLTSAFERLPHLCDIEFRSGADLECDVLNVFDASKDSRHRHARAMTRLTSISQKTLVAPLIDPESDFFHVNRLRALMVAAYSARCNITHVDAAALDPDQIERKLPDPSGMFENILNLQLTLRNFQTSSQGAAKILQSMPKLEQLCLSFDRQDDIFYLSDLLSSKSRHSNLRYLSLKDFDIHKSDFTQFLEAHATVLESLTLEGLSVDGSFAELAIFLSESMNLKHVRFRYKIGNGVNEDWYFDPSIKQVDRCCTTVGISQCCLLHRLERYVLRGGPCPFERCEWEDPEVKSEGTKFTWCAAEDYSLHTPFFVRRPRIDA